MFAVVPDTVVKMLVLKTTAFELVKLNTVVFKSAPPLPAPTMTMTLPTSSVVKVSVVVANMFVLAVPDTLDIVLIFEPGSVFAGTTNVKANLEFDPFAVYSTFGVKFDTAMSYCPILYLLKSLIMVMFRI